MASKKIYIDNGTEIDANWKGLIAVSVDGVKWSTYPKDGLKVEQYTFTLTTTGENNINKFNTPGDYVILSEFSNKEPFLRFLPTDVVNQSWSTANDAIGDISTWIGEIYP